MPATDETAADASLASPLRVAYTLEQLWHEHPGGTAVAATRVAERLAARADVEPIGVAGRHRRPPVDGLPPIPLRALPVARPRLYETWLRAQWPLVEAATGPVDVCHATGLVPAASRAPLVVTVHDLAFVRYPDRFTRHGARVMRRSLERIRRGADLVLCSSRATVADVVDAGIDEARVRLVPLGVEIRPATAAEIEELRRRHDLPDVFVLFVGTVEPRKNLARLARAVAALPDAVPLVVVGADGWGDAAADVRAVPADVRFVGHVSDADLRAWYGAASVFAYPSEWEGFGLPVAEALAHGTAVVTSVATSMEEIAAGAAHLVDPLDVDDIARGLTDALADPGRFRAAGRSRAAELSWDATAEATVRAYRDVAGR